MTPERAILSADITDAGSLGRKVLQARTTEEIRKLLVLPRKRSVTLERLGWWTVGAMVSLAVASVLAVAYWSQTRTIKESMEGGWTRTVIDYDVSYLEIFTWVAPIVLAVWTVGFVAFVLIEDNS